MKIVNKDIAVVVKVSDHDNYVQDTLVTLKRSFEKPINVYIFSGVKDRETKMDLRTICNSLESDDFNIKLIEKAVTFPEEHDFKLIEENFIILVSKSVFFLIDDWHTKMVDYVCNFGQPYYTLGPHVAMFKKSAWQTVANQEFYRSGVTADSSRAYLTR